MAHDLKIIEGQENDGTHSLHIVDSYTGSDEIAFKQYEQLSTYMNWIMAPAVTKTGLREYEKGFHELTDRLLRTSGLPRSEYAGTKGVFISEGSYLGYPTLERIMETPLDFFIPLWHPVDSEEKAMEEEVYNNISKNIPAIAKKVLDARTTLAASQEFMKKINVEIYTANPKMQEFGKAFSAITKKIVPTGQEFQDLSINMLRATITLTELTENSSTAMVSTMPGADASQIATWKIMPEIYGYMRNTPVKLFIEPGIKLLAAEIYK